MPWMSFPCNYGNINCSSSAPQRIFYHNLMFSKKRFVNISWELKWKSKVIQFQERQRDKDSPYNFSVPPQVGIDLDTYEKTGETKVVPLTPETKAELKEPEPKKPDIPTTSYTLATMMQQMQNPFPFPLDPQTLLHGQLPQLPPQTATTGRRANRTRFTDFQLRTLQQFFDKQVCFHF